MKKHMRTLEFIILSAELENLHPSENNTRTDRLEYMLNELRLPYKAIEGVYKGVSEASFLVVVKDESEIECVTDLGLKSFGQESILFRDFKGQASLVFNNGITQDIGTFTRTTEVSECYSIVGGQKWVCS